MTDNGFRNVFEQKSDELLIDIIQNKREEYTEEALTDAENILVERGYEINVIEEPVPSSEKDLKEDGPKTNNDISPLVASLVMAAISIIISITSTKGDLFVFGLLFSITVRIIVLLWTHSLCEKYRLNTGAWMLVGLLFGSWSLIILTFVTWGKIDPKGEQKKS
jgi:hypothetical protein